MNRSSAQPVVALVVHARDVPAREREQFAATLRTGLAGGSLILETCHRVEAYAAGVDDAELAPLVDMLPDGGRILRGEVAVRHAIDVATGRDSVVVGEDQILHQLRMSLESARRSGALDPAIERLFALALQAGRRARSWQPGRRRSLADVALEVVERMAGSVRDREILVVGAGRMGDLAARVAAAAGARVTVANRSSRRARELARVIGGTTTELDPGPAVGAVAGIVVAIGGPWAIGAATVAALRAGDAIVVDLSVPVAVPDALVSGLGDRLVTVDEIAVASEIDADAPDPRTDRLIEAVAEEFLEWQARGDARAAADALVRHADREREAELASLWRTLPTLDPEERAAIEGMTRHLAARLLRQPLERLGRDSDGADGRAVRDLFAL